MENIGREEKLINELSIIPDRINISLREAHNNTFGIPRLFIFTSYLLVINSQSSILNFQLVL